mmetsp:Transcript_34629/g.98120  ORF Transcript_34629/g.98120 Transcript_34629/m.98120 type:complete len:285 (-) Transcript_34629:493-1347(-)
MGLVNKGLEILRSARPAANCKGVGDVVAKGRVVCVLLHCHELDGVVAKFLHSGQHVVFELKVGGHLGLCGSHANMRLIDPQGLRALRPLVLPLMGLGGVPVDSVVFGTHDPGLHGGPADPCREAIHPPAARVLKPDLHARAMGDGGAPVRTIRQGDTPHPKLVLLHPGAGPVVEIADELSSACCRGPLAVDGAAILSGEAKGVVPLGESFKAAFGLGYVGLCALIGLQTVTEVYFMRGVLRVLAQQHLQDILHAGAGRRSRGNPHSSGRWRSRLGEAAACRPAA